MGRRARLPGHRMGLSVMTLLFFGIIVNMVVILGVIVTARMTMRSPLVHPRPPIDVLPPERIKEIHQVSAQAARLQQRDRARILQHVA